jgi:hypothetical protein
LKIDGDGKFSRGEFLRLCAGGAGALALAGGVAGAAQPVGVAKAEDATAKGADGGMKVAVAAAADSGAWVCDLRGFVRWIVEVLEPSVRLAGGAGRYPDAPGGTEATLYGAADMACVLYAIGALHPTEKQRAEWGEAFEKFQNAETGWFLQQSFGLSPEHNTAFALGAMQLLDLTPRYVVKMDAEYSDPRAFLATLNWKTNVYRDAHRGAGIGAIYTLRGMMEPGTRSTAWFAEYFAACDGYFDAKNGLMGVGKPAMGDTDQIGGTFHYAFVYEYFNRRMPYPEKRIDTVLGLQREDGFWLEGNYLWLTLDAIYLMTRTLRYCEHRREEVCASVRRAVKAVEAAAYSSEGRTRSFAKGQAVHAATVACAIGAEAQSFLGAGEVVTDWPLKLVLDRRPFI